MSDTTNEYPQNSRLFNPNEHLMKIGRGEQAKDYLPVAWRLVWFRSLCPNGEITTEIVHLDLDRETEEEAYVWNAEKRKSEKVIKRAPGFAMFRATVKDGKGGIATGTKSEKAASFPDFIEKAETGSIGRALAALGYGTQFTGDEFDERHRIVDSPVDRGQSEETAASNTQTTNKTAQSTGQQQPSAIPDMLRKAKGRAGKAKIASNVEEWATFIAGVLGTSKTDEQITLTDIAKINGELTKREQPAEVKS